MAVNQNELSIRLLSQCCVTRWIKMMSLQLSVRPE